VSKKQIQTKFSLSRGAPAPLRRDPSASPGTDRILRLPTPRTFLFYFKIELYFYILMHSSLVRSCMYPSKYL
jgi:hypothetical protein